jgi:peptidoglycan hydrolase CwlO-like protein
MERRRAEPGVRKGAGRARYGKETSTQHDRSRWTRRRRGAHVFVVVLAALLLLALAVPAASAEPSVAGARARLAEVQRQVDAVAAQLTAAAGSLEAAAAELARVQDRITEETRRIVLAQDELAMARERLATRVVEMYKSRSTDLLDVILSVRGYQDLVVRLDYFRRLDAADSAIVTECEHRTAELARRKERLLGQRAHAEELIAEAARRKEELTTALAQRRKLLTSARAEVKQALRRQELARAAARAARAAAAVARAGIAPSVLDLPHGGDFTPRSWAQALLRNLALPSTVANQRAIVAWEAAEGGHWFNTAHFNPLNTTQSAPGATAMNSVGVKAYVSWEQGMRATITTLYNGFYAGILAALRRGDDAQAVADAVAASPWGTGSFSVAALAPF